MCRYEESIGLDMEVDSDEDGAETAEVSADETAEAKTAEAAVVVGAKVGPPTEATEASNEHSTTATTKASENMENDSTPDVPASGMEAEVEVLEDGTGEDTKNEETQVSAIKPGAVTDTTKEAAVANKEKSRTSPIGVLIDETAADESSADEDQSTQTEDSRPTGEFSEKLYKPGGQDEPVVAAEPRPNSPEETAPTAKVSQTNSESIKPSPGSSRSTQNNPGPELEPNKIKEKLNSSQEPGEKEKTSRTTESKPNTQNSPEVPRQSTAPPAPVNPPVGEPPVVKNEVIEEEDAVAVQPMEEDDDEIQVIFFKAVDSDSPKTVPSKSQKPPSKKKFGLELGDLVQDFISGNVPKSRTLEKIEKNLVKVETRRTEQILRESSASKHGDGGEIQILSRQHRSSAEPEAPIVETCGFCSEPFSNIKSFYVHLARTHFREQLQKKLYNDPSTYSHAEWKCPSCKIFVSQDLDVIVDHYGARCLPYPVKVSKVID